jgi:hypothetical protein
MHALEGQQLLEDDPTVVYLTAYLLILDAQYDFLARHHRQMIARAEDAEKLNRKLHVDLATAQAHVYNPLLLKPQLPWKVVKPLLLKP